MELVWDKVGERVFETGVDHGVLYIPNGSGVYDAGYAWNGLVGVTESPSGAEATPLYADNIKYLNLTSVEEFGGTIEAFTYPSEFEQCDGSASPEQGITIGQQDRKMFGLCYRSKVGNDLDAEAGYKLHLIYGAKAAPSEKAYATVNDAPEAITFSWEVTTTPVAVAGLKPTSSITIDSTKVDADSLAALENFLFGTEGTEPSLPLPDAVVALFAGSVTTVTASAPTYNSSTDVVTIPTVTGVVYMIDGEVVTGTVTITESVVVTASLLPGYKFSAISDSDWTIIFA